MSENWKIGVGMMYLVSRKTKQRLVKCLVHSKDLGTESSHYCNALY